MKKLIAVLTVLSLSAGLLTGCGTNYDALKSTIYILSSGKIILTEAADFDEESYSRDDLEAFSKDNISYYNQQAGAERVKLRKLWVQNGMAMMTMEFASAEDYSAFTGNYLVCGTTDELQKEGISFDGDFVSLDGKNIASSCTAEDILAGKTCSVVIANGDYDIQLPKKICYISAEGIVPDTRKSITIDPSYDILDAQQSSEEAGGQKDAESDGSDDAASDSSAGKVGKDSDGDDSGQENASGKSQEVQTGSASDGSITEDEILAVGEEAETETEAYDFNADYAANADPDEENQAEDYNKHVYIFYR